MDAEQVNQDGAQDALDAGQQNTSDDARRELPAVDRAADNAPGTLAETPGDVLDEPAGAEASAPAHGDAAGTDTLDVAPGTAVPGDETPGSVAEEVSAPSRPAPGTPGAALAGEEIEPAGEAQDLGVSAAPAAPDAAPAAGGSPSAEDGVADTAEIAAPPAEEDPAADPAAADREPAEAAAASSAAPVAEAPHAGSAPDSHGTGPDTAVAEAAAPPVEQAPAESSAPDPAAAGQEPAEAAATGPATAPAEGTSQEDRAPSPDTSDQEDTDVAEEPAEPDTPLAAAVTATSLMFHAPDLDELREAAQQRAARRREARRRQQEDDATAEDPGDGAEAEAAELAEEAEEAEQSTGGGVTSRRRRRRRRGDVDMELVGGSDDDPPNTVTRVRAPRAAESATVDEVVAVKGSTRLEAKKQRRRESRQTGRRRQVITEAEFLARRESVERRMLVRQKDNRIQIGVLEDGVLAEHFVSHTQQDSLIGNVYVGKVQNVLPSMEAAFIDIGRGRNAVLYAGEVNWDASRLEGGPRRIEVALKSGDSVLVQVTKDPVGHKGARLTSQISLPGRYLVYVPGGSMTGISRKLPDVERARLKKILKDRLPDGAGVIVRTAAEGASEQELTHDINRLRAQWEQIQERAGSTKTLAPEMLYAEPDLTIKTVRDVFNEDFTTMVVQGDEAWDNIEAYVTYVAPDLLDRLQKWDEDEDLFVNQRVEEQIQKALDRKVFLPSGGSLVIDRTEAMTVVDVNTGKFTGSGGNLEETVTKNNLEAAEEIVRQLRLRDIGGIIVIDFIDMVLESNRDLVLRRLVECLGRDRTKHQVAEVTSLGLVQMTRKRMGTGLLEVFSEPCEHCAGRGVVVHDHPLEGRTGGVPGEIRDQRPNRTDRTDRKRGRRGQAEQPPARPEARTTEPDPAEKAKAEAARTAFATIAAATHHETPEEAETPRAEEPAAPAESRPEGSGRSRKKRRGKRSRNRGQGAETAAEQQETGETRSPAEPEPAAEEPAAEQGSRLTIKGEVIELPQGHAPVAEEPAEAPRLSLDSLAEAFDQREPEQRSAAPAAGASAAEPEGASAEPAQSPARERQVTSQAPSGPSAGTTAGAPAEPARPRRRSRRASAPAARPGEAQVTAGQAAAAEGGRHEATTAAELPQRAPAGQGPTVVGVGVKAEDLTSGRPAGQG
ncbi:Rne/Rng family ribonuclease [Kocuria sediminis]|uniref:Ribonuclease E n=1 Tax=Kocuria sediminis TaxID=1038857 RepID=A0A6N8GG67_9MICC|nr:Rne/Rng family ribonuclease [Kocuria sediminis]MUN61928.1 Rne/Rng family ribonuclease [Kocuria sediminis]